MDLLHITFVKKHILLSSQNKAYVLGLCFWQNPTSAPSNQWRKHLAKIFDYELIRINSLMKPREALLQKTHGDQALRLLCLKGHVRARGSTLWRH